MPQRLRLLVTSSLVAMTLLATLMLISSPATTQAAPSAITVTLFA